jgi:hypothetical protein
MFCGFSRHPETAVRASDEMQRHGAFGVNVS